MGYRGSAGEEEEEERQEGGGRAEVADLVSGGGYEVLDTLDCICLESRVRRGPYAAPSLAQVIKTILQGSRGCSGCTRGAESS